MGNIVQHLLEKMEKGKNWLFLFLFRFVYYSFHLLKEEFVFLFFKMPVLEKRKVFSKVYDYKKKTFVYICDFFLELSNQINNK